MEEYWKLGEVVPYKIAVNIGRQSWKIYEIMDRDIKRMIGEQFIRAVDSVAANIAEGYGRFHFKDRIKFYYNARGSLFEVKHWLLVLKERNVITLECFEQNLKEVNTLHRELNTYIKICLNNKKINNK